MTTLICVFFRQLRLHIVFILIQKYCRGFVMNGPKDLIVRNHSAFISASIFKVPFPNFYLTSYQLVQISIELKDNMQR